MTNQNRFSMNQLPSSDANAVGGRDTDTAMIRMQKSMDSFPNWRKARKSRLQQEECILKLQNRITQLRNEED